MFATKPLVVDTDRALRVSADEGGCCGKGELGEGLSVMEGSEVCPGLELFYF